MKLRRLETRIRRSPRGHVAQPDNGNNPAERPSQAKGQRGKPSKCIFPNLLQPSDHPSKSHDQGKTLSPKIAPSFEDGGLLSSPGSSQGDSHAVKDSMLDHGDDDDHGSSVDIDDLSSIESDDLDRLLGYRDECFSSTLIPDPASVAELVSLQGCNTSTDEPEQTMGFFDGAHAQSNRNPMLVPSLEETSCQTVISHALSQARFACPGLRGGTVDPKDGTIVMLEGPGQKDHDSPVVEVPGDTLHDRSGQEPAALMVCLPDIVEHSSSPAGNRRQSLGTQEGPMFATDNTAAVGSAVEYSNAEKIDRLLTTVWEGTSPDLESASPYGGLPGQHGIREVCRIKPTAFEEQYTTYQRSRSGKEVECQTVPSSVSCIPLGILREPISCAQSVHAFVPNSAIDNIGQRSRSREPENLSSALPFNPANGVRRSMRTVKSRVLEQGSIDHEAPKAKVLTENVHTIAIKAKTTSVKRLRSAIDLRVEPATLGHTKAPEPVTPVEGEATGLESPLKKSKLTDTPTSSSTQTESNIEVHEDESMAGGSDEEFVPTALETTGAAKTLQPKISPPFLASPPSSIEARTPSPKKRGLLAAVPPRHTSRKMVIAKSPTTVYEIVDPVKESTVMRPPPHGKPLVWAEGRQALCETLPYYRAYQSGSYTHDNLCFGFLLDRDCGERAFMDEEVVITRAGGGCSVDEDGDMRQSQDQKSSATTVKNFLNNKKYGVPVALIVGKKNKNCPSAIPYEYCVMDWFQVTDVWPEKSHGKKCFKFRFEKIDLATKSWWAAEGTPDPPKIRDFSIKAIREECVVCDEESAQIFQEGWMCLNEECSEFWFLQGEAAPAKLSYDNRFLRERTEWPKHIKPPFSLRPALLEVDIGNDAGYAVSRVCWKGMACPKCGRCNSREHWNEWRCQTKHCGFTYNVKQSVLSPRAVLEVHEVEFVGHALPQDTFASPVTEQVTLMDNWRVHTYNILPGNVITHFSANSAINKRPGGPHDTFVALQGADMALQRFPLKNSGLKGPMLTNHFASNFGMPYKYVVDVNSKPFAEAPTPILNALHRLTWAGQKTVNDGTFLPFNELLTLGYFEQQKIGVSKLKQHHLVEHISPDFNQFHDDGESTLGPTVATLSLGGQAKMMIRMKASYYSGKTKAGKYDPLAPVLPGCKGYEERVRLNSLYGKVSKEAFEEAKAAVYKDLGRIGNAPVLLTLQLNHGDMVVMHGGEMQKYYEHSVIPSGKLRFALTCRYVRPELVDADQHWKGNYTAEPGMITAYDGDEVAVSESVPLSAQSFEDWTMVDAPSPGAV